MINRILSSLYRICTQGACEVKLEQDRSAVLHMSFVAV